MNQIIVEANVVEIEASELEAAQSQDSLIELNASQLMLIGGGTSIVVD